MSGHSIRFRFVGWLHRLADKIGEGVPQALRCDQAHADSMREQDFATVLPIPGRAPERQIDDATILAILRHHIDKCRNDAGIFDVNLATKQALAACHNSPNFINHQKSPFSQNLDLSSVNRSQAGVQS